MITSDKDWTIYAGTCECGQELRFKSNQKADATEYCLCECYRVNQWQLNPSDTKKGRMNRDADTMTLRLQILEVFADLQMECTVRQLYYQLVTRGYPKTEAFYGRAQRELLHMRQEGVLSYNMIIDNSRRRIKYPTFDTGMEALDSWMQHYKQNVWSGLDTYCEIWLEKRALEAVFRDVCYEYDVPLCVSSGFASESFIHQAAEQMKAIGKRSVVYYFSDYDPSGLALSNAVRGKLPRFGVRNFDFARVALSQEQINTYSLPMRETKKSNHSRGFDGDSCELDALNPRVLKQLISGCINDLIPAHHMRNIQVEQEVQLQTLNNMKLRMHA